MTAVEGLIEWLGQIHASDQKAAEDCAAVYPSPWDMSDRGYIAYVTADGPNFWRVTELDQDACPGEGWLGDRLVHIARNDPAAALARIASERAIITCLVDLMAEEQERWDDYCAWIEGRAKVERPTWRFTEDEIKAVPGLRLAVRHIGAAYGTAGREGYREDWRP